MSDFPWHSIALDGRKIRELVVQCRKLGVPYKLGGKVTSLSVGPETLGRGIDCSGFVRWAIYQASPADKRVIMPDGSWNQGDWADAQKFKDSDVASCLLKDGRIRLAYWNHAAGISHIVLVLNGKTLESHGSKGPDRRTWNLDTGWMAACKVWVLDMAQDDLAVPT